MKKFEITMQGEVATKIIEADGYDMSPALGQFYKSGFLFMNFWEDNDGEKVMVAIVSISTIKFMTITEM